MPGSFASGSGRDQTGAATVAADEREEPAAGGRRREERGPSILLDGTLLVSGEVPRVPDFETGFPIHFGEVPGGGYEPDPLIVDDQNVIVHVRDKGLVIVSGCSHSGAVNVLRNAPAVTGVDRIAGFIGGLPLTGAVFEPVIEPTIAAFAGAGVGSTFVF